MVRRLLGSATTNSSGVATLTYTGTGKGKLRIVASSGDVESNVRELWDTLLFDNGANTSYNKGSAITVTNGETGKSCSVVSANTTNGMLIYPNALTGDFEIILKADTSNYYTRIGVSTSSTVGQGQRTFIQQNRNGEYYYRITREDGVYSASYSSDLENWTSLTFTYNNADTETVYFFIGQYNTSDTATTFSFTDLKAYYHI